MKPKIIIITLFLMFSLISCSRNTLSAAEVKEFLIPLVEQSAELNTIYFGEGLPATGDMELIKQFNSSFGTGGEIKTSNYIPVDKDCGYASKDEIKAATLEVFTEDYSEFLFTRAFDGIVTVMDDGVGEVTQTSSYARYLEKSGILTVRKNLSEEALPLGRTYLWDEMKIIRSDDESITVTVPTELDGKRCDVELKAVQTENGWRLDSPTY